MARFHGADYGDERNYWTREPQQKPEKDRSSNGSDNYQICISARGLRYNSELEKLHNDASKVMKIKSRRLSRLFKSGGVEARSEG